MNKNIKKDRVVYLDILRILAIFAVIFIHVSAQNFLNLEIYTDEWNIRNTYNSISRWSIPVLVMISGALFLGYKEEIDIKTLYKNNILRMAIIFFIWSAFYILTKLDFGNLIIESALISLFRGDVHLWFLPMIISIYMMIPILKKITESEDITKYFLVLSFVLVFLIPFFLKEDSIIKNISYFYNEFDLKLISGYTIYFVLGYYLYKFDISKKEQVAIYILGILGFILTPKITLIKSMIENKIVTDYYTPFNINILLQSMAVFVFGKYQLSKIKLNGKIENFICKLSKYSLGIYLIHIFVFRMLYNMGISTLLFNQWLSIPAIATIVFIISAIISAILNYIPKINRFIV